MDKTTQIRPKPNISDFDTAAFYKAMDEQRISRGLSWQQAADQIWDQSAELNAQRKDHPISPATIKGMAARGDCTCQHALFFLRWLGRSPETFLTADTGDRETASLPPAGPDRRLRWKLSRTYEALNARRLELGLSWSEVAAELGCTKHQLTGIRTARFAIGMKLAMRIVQWLGQPAAAFIYAARW